jgi:hypothetical protein
MELADERRQNAIANPKKEPSFASIRFDAAKYPISSTPYICSGEMA